MILLIINKIISYSASGYCIEVLPNYLFKNIYNQVFPLTRASDVSTESILQFAYEVRRCTVF